MGGENNLEVKSYMYGLFRLYVSCFNGSVFSQLSYFGHDVDYTKWCITFILSGGGRSKHYLVSINIFLKDQYIMWLLSMTNTFLDSKQ